MMKRLAWGRKVDQAFRDKVRDICYIYNWPDSHADWLMACMAFETGETFSPRIRNAAGSGAIGLIQFMPRTAESLATATDLLAQMTAVEQLTYVRRYFKPYAHRIHTLSDMYMAILLPKYVGAGEDEILFASGTVAYRQNSGLDINSDGKITKAEAASKVQKKLERGMGTDFLYIE